MSFRLLNVGGRSALQSGESFYDLEAASEGRFSSCPMEAVRRHIELHSVDLANAEPQGLIRDAHIEAPVPSAKKIFGIGLNYRAHAEESNMDIPDTPVVFSKFSNCICGPTSDVVIRGEHCDYEVELVVVIGATCKDVREEDAWNRIMGVTCGQDISDRRVQMAAKPPQFDLGKSFDTFGPIGPAVVSLDQIPNPDAVALSCHINGEERQNSRSDDLIFSVPRLIAYLSRVATLEPGDLIFTGTPSGVGAAQKKYLRDGDIIVSRLEGVGEMTNHVVAD